MEDTTGPAAQQRNIIAVQDMNRKGRTSPLPQAVQGVQSQPSIPGAEPGIKSEFGRMFSGIGSGVSGLGMSSPVTSAPAVPFTGSPLVKRDEDGGLSLDHGTEPGEKNGKGRRRKLKGEDGPDDDSSGRRTPLKNKRVKVPHHHHQ